MVCTGVRLIPARTIWLAGFRACGPAGWIGPTKASTDMSNILTFIEAAEFLIEALPRLTAYEKTAARVRVGPMFASRHIQLVKECRAKWAHMEQAKPGVEAAIAAAAHAPGDVRAFREFFVLLSADKRDEAVGRWPGVRAMLDDYVLPAAAETWVSAKFAARELNTTKSTISKIVNRRPDLRRSAKPEDRRTWPRVSHVVHLEGLRKALFDAA